MKRPVLLLFCFFCFTQGVIAQTNKWSIAFGAFGGLPVNRSSGDQHFYLKNFDAGMGFNAGLFYTAKSNWQFGLLMNADNLFLNRKKSEQAIVQSQSDASLLNRAKGGGDIVTFSIAAEIGKRFLFRKWIVTPFIRSSFLYSSSASSGFSLKQKIPEEHYFVQTEWRIPDSNMTVHFAPLMLAAGIHADYLLTEKVSIYSSVQYRSATISLNADKQQTDFYGKKTAEQQNFRQAYRLLGLEFGVRINVGKALKGKTSDNTY